MIKMLAKIITVSMLCVMGMISPAFSCGQTSFPAAPSTGKVRGTVLDFNEAVIPNATIVFDGGPTKRKVISDESGQYEIALPAGRYRVSVEATEDFQRFRRAPFQVQPNTSTMINVMLATSPFPICVLQVGTPSKVPQSPKFTPPKYDSFSPSHSSGRPLELLVQFHKKRRNKGLIKYDRVMLSYDALTVYADEVRFDPQNLRLQAGGNVIVEDGKERTHAKNAEVEFKEGQPIIKLTQQ